jgi:hypothetical protein
MKTKMLKILSFLGLFLTLAPAFFVFFNVIEFETHKLFMLVGTLLWFLTAPFWMNREKDTEINSN